MWLQITAPDGSEERPPIEGDRFLIGSAQGCDVRLDDPGVSPEHLWIEGANGVIRLEDLASRDGTWVDDARVSRAELHGGETIRVGRTVLRLWPEAPPPPRRRKAFSRWGFRAATAAATAAAVSAAVLVLSGDEEVRRTGIPTEAGPQAPPVQQGVGARRTVRPVLGVNAQFIFPLPGEVIAAQLDAMARSGVRMLRMDADWALMEPVPPAADGTHKWRWSRHDPFVEQFARRGLEWLPILGYSTRWSGRIAGDVHSPPKDIGQYAAFTRAFAERYGERGSFWREHPDLPYKPVKRYEIWNEPNLAKAFWKPGPADPGTFARLYLAARAQIKAVDPAATVITGGLAGRDDAPSFAKRMFRGVPELRGRVDGFGFHPYGRTAEESYFRTRDMRKALDSVGARGVPLDITEVGWSSPPGARGKKGRVVSERQRVRFLRDVTRVYPRSDCGVRIFAAHTWISFEQNAADPEHWFGIWNANGTPKPSGTAYVRELRRSGVAAARATRKPKYRICGP